MVGERPTLIAFSMIGFEAIASPTIAPVARSTSADRARKAVGLAHLKIAKSP